MMNTPMTTMAAAAAAAMMTSPVLTSLVTLLTFA
jgi:hypothetical protein